MKKKSPSNVDIGQTMLQIQAQLASLDKKLEAFINKSLIDIAETLAVQKAAVQRSVHVPQAQVRVPDQPRRAMYAIVCYQCGKDSEIPFKPTPGRSVYCTECFAQKKSGQQPPKINVELKPPVVELKPQQQPAVVAKAKKKTSAPKKTAVKKAKKKGSR